VIVSPNKPEPALRFRDDRASQVEAVADQLLALLEEFEAALSRGRIPATFAERLSDLRHTAERLIDP